MTLIGRLAGRAGLITATENQMLGRGCVLVDDSGKAATRPGVPTSRGCFVGENFECPHSCSICGDGTVVAYIDPQQPEAADHHVILVRETATGGELARVAIAQDQAGHPFVLSIEGSLLLVNRWSPYSGNFLKALLFDLDNPQQAPSRVPIAGSARLVETPVDIVAPITLSDD